MKLGICLTGGGAKGAFEAGALKKIYEQGLEPVVVSGTSIGAVNGYFLMLGCLKELEGFWLSMDRAELQGRTELIIDNSAMIGELRKLQGRSSRTGSLYVNYVAIDNRILTEKIVNLVGLEKEEALEAVKYSSLLPYRPEKSDRESGEKLKFDSARIFEGFKSDVSIGIYDGFRLDGGILNNSLLSPFITDRVDKLLIIALKNNYEVPAYIYQYYNPEDIITLEPNVTIVPEDTLRFDGVYCRDMFYNGYRSAEVVIKDLTNKASESV